MIIHLLGSISLSHQSHKSYLTFEYLSVSISSTLFHCCCCLIKPMKKLIFPASIFLIITQTYTANAATITFGAFSYSTPQVNYSSLTGSKYTSFPNILRADAESYAPPPLPLNFTNRSTIEIREHSTFKVNPSVNEKNGQTIQAILTGDLLGELYGSSQGAFNVSMGSYFASVAAKVAAGPISWSSPSHSINRNLTDDVFVRDQVYGSGQLTIGQTYDFDMALFVNSSALSLPDGSSSAGSDFYTSQGNNNRRFYATVEAVPEPSTTLGSIIFLGFGASIKRQYARKCKKVKQIVY